MDEYELLGVRRDATPEEIKAAFRRRARELHPDHHVRADGTVPEAATRAFAELGEAMRRALAVRSVLDATAFAAAREAPLPAGGIPAQRRSGSRGSAMGRTPSREHDPMLSLLTLPQRCTGPWSDAALEVWALTVVPAARTHLAEARADAAAAGPRTPRQHTVATVHALLTRTLTGRTTKRYAPLAGVLAPAYATLASELPDRVVERLPEPVSQIGPRTRTLLVAAATGAALGGVAVWTAAVTGAIPG